jgi:hypothetical protein
MDEVEIDIQEFGGTLYINMPKLSKCGKQAFKDFMRTARARIYKQVHGVDAVIRVPGPQGCPHMWAVEEMANMYIMSISAEFAVKAMGWIKAWKAQHADHVTEWRHAVETHIPDDTRCDLEKRVVDAFCAQVPNCTREVGVELGSQGYVDVLTDSHLYEVKTWRNWRHAVGQALCYGASFPTRQLVVVLFDTPGDRMGDVELAQVRTVCAKYEVDVKLVNTDP